MPVVRADPAVRMTVREVPADLVAKADQEGNVDQVADSTCCPDSWPRGWN